jgi:hypothetical protein
LHVVDLAGASALHPARAPIDAAYVGHGANAARPQQPRRNLGMP